MFRHKGKGRTLKHNLRIASVLSFVAGIVNVAGFLSVQRLTTNVTGHFAFFVDEVFQLNFWKGFIYFMYILFFFLGSFSSNAIIEIGSRKKNNYVYTIPVLIETFILFIISFGGNYLIEKNPNLLAFSLLFAMGLQNSLVTTISNAAVRTTHLTGLFTDLGIDLSQLFFQQEKEKSKLKASIKLRLTIIAYFFIGGLVGGIFYSTLTLGVLLIAATTLALGLVYDKLKLKIIRLTIRSKQKNKPTN